MTLDTSVYIHDEIRYRDLWIKCNQLIGATEATRFRDEQVKTWRNGVGAPEPDNAWNIGNEVDQGLCALLDIYYRPDGPLRTTDNDCEWYCDAGCDDEHSAPACWLEVSFDTAYSYTGGNGEGCGDLHARIVAELGRWLDGYSVRWSWKNEFTGEIHEGLHGLHELGDGGKAANAWFTDTAMPAIASEVAVDAAAERLVNEVTDHLVEQAGGGSDA